MTQQKTYRNLMGKLLHVLDVLSCNCFLNSEKEQANTLNNMDSLALSEFYLLLWIRRYAIKEDLYLGIDSIERLIISITLNSKSLYSGSQKFHQTHLFFNLKLVTLPILSSSDTKKFAQKHVYA